MSKSLLLGTKRGKLYFSDLVLHPKYNRKYYFCICDCGNTIYCRPDNINKFDCGCVDRAALIDKQFHKGVVIAFAGSKNNSYLWQRILRNNKRVEQRKCQKLWLSNRTTTIFWVDSKILV